MSEKQLPQDDDAFELEAIDGYYARIRAPLLYYFGTTDVSLLTEVWADQAQARDALRAPSPDRAAAPTPDVTDAEQADHDVVLAWNQLSEAIDLCGDVTVQNRARTFVGILNIWRADYRRIVSKPAGRRPFDGTVNLSAVTDAEIIATFPTLLTEWCVERFVGDSDVANRRKTQVWELLRELIATRRAVTSKGSLTPRRYADDSKERA